MTDEEQHSLRTLMSIFPTCLTGSSLQLAMDVETTNWLRNVALRGARGGGGDVATQVPEELRSHIMLQTYESFD